VVDQHTAKNVGNTILAWRDSLNDEPRALEPGEEVKINTPTGILLVKNRSTEEDGKFRVQVYKKKSSKKRKK